MLTPPLVSVIMPAYNTEAYIGFAVESILNQTYPHFEFLIFDDCSTDNTAGIVASYNDRRIILVKKEKQTGYTSSLVAGIDAARGKYIARMDSDDISETTRLEKQVNFLESSAEYGIVGSHVKTIGGNHPGSIWRYPLDDDDVRVYMLVNSPFAHPVVMIRKEILDKHKLNYLTFYEPCEDYKLWTDLLKVAKGKNIDEALLSYRLHNNQTISIKKEMLLEKANLVRQEILQSFFNIEMKKKELNINYYYFNEIQSNTACEIIKKHHWRMKLIKVFKREKKYEKVYHLVNEYWIKNLLTLGEYKISFLKFLFDKAVLKSLSPKQQLTFFIKCIFQYKVNFIQ